MVIKGSGDFSEKINSNKKQIQFFGRGGGVLGEGSLNIHGALVSEWRDQSTSVQNGRCKWGCSGLYTQK